MIRGARWIGEVFAGSALDRRRSFRLARDVGEHEFNDSATSAYTREDARTLLLSVHTFVIFRTLKL
jgi:hypothetical protein